MLCGCACAHEQVIGVSHCWLRAAGAEKRMETSAIWNLVRNLWSAKMFSPQGESKPAASATVSHLVQSLWARHQTAMASEIHTHTQILYIQVFVLEIQKHKLSLKRTTSDCKHVLASSLWNQTAGDYCGANCSNIDIYYPPLLWRTLLYKLHLTSFSLLWCWLELKLEQDQGNWPYFIIDSSLC